MSESTPEGKPAASKAAPKAAPKAAAKTESDANNVSERVGDVMGKVNDTLGKVDWSQMGKYGKAAGIVAVVVIAQVIIKVVIDTINFFPLLPGLLELLGVVVLGQWSWQNLTTSEKRNAVFDRVQNLRKEYLG
tara:strand:- start:2029 stop:2427 length:399 start_codon:yes stop_codon:yes gene_type:complete